MKSSIRLIEFDARQNVLSILVRLVLSTFYPGLTDPLYILSHPVDEYIGGKKAWINYTIFLSDDSASK